MRHTPPQHHGFALLLMLVLLAVAAVALAQLSRRSGREALDTLERENQVQRYWAMRSCRETLMPRIQQALQNAAANMEDRHRQFDDASPVPAVVRRHIQLSSLDVTLIFSDEQAKLNANALAQRLGAHLAERKLQDLADQTRSGMRINLQPLPDDDALPHREQQDDNEDAPDEGSMQPLMSYEQLAQNIRPNALIGDRDAPGLADLVTLWGNGKVHYRRAPRSVLNAALSPDLGPGQVQQFVQMRNTDPEQGLDRMLDRLALSRRVRQRVSERLIGSSRCHSLWIVLDDGKRRRYNLSVKMIDTYGDPHAYRLHW